MAQSSASQRHFAYPASKMERDVVLWTMEGGELENKFAEIEQREHDACLKAQAETKAKYEAKQTSLSTKLSPSEARELSDLTESAANAELAKLWQEYEAGRDWRAKRHAEDIKLHHEKFHAWLSQPRHAPVANPFAPAAQQHNNAAYQSNGATAAYSAYAAPSAQPAATPGHGSVVTTAPAVYTSHPDSQAVEGPAQTYSPTSKFYQQRRASKGAPATNVALQLSRAEESRPALASGAWENQRLNSNADWRGTQDPRSVSTPVQHTVPSQFVLPSQRDQNELAAQQGAAAQTMVSSTVSTLGAESRGAPERPMATGRRSSGAADATVDPHEQIAGRVKIPRHSKRKVDEAAASPPSTSAKRVKGLATPAKKENEKRPGTAGSDTSLASGRMSSPRLQSSKKRALAGGRTLTFDEIYQGGRPKYNHLIVEFPPNSALFYILRCDEHGVHFNATNPLAGAAKHLASAQHGNMTKEHANAIEQIGWRIVDCTPEKAHMNNEMVKAAFAKGYKPHNRNFLTKRDRNSLEASATTPAAATPTGRKVPARRQETVAAKSPPTTPSAKRPAQAITAPAPGQLYRAFWSEEKRNYAVLVLPWGDLGRVGFTGTLGTTGLLNRAPKCYVIDRMVPKILGWADGFEDGGPFVEKREFPVCYFDHKASVGWVRAKDLLGFDFDDPDSVPNFEEAVKHFAKVQETKTGQADDGGARSTGSQLEKRDNMLPPSAHSTPKALEDEVMTDAPAMPGDMPGDDSDSYRASEGFNTETEVDMDGTDSRRTSISNKAAPPASGQGLSASVLQPLTAQPAPTGETSSDAALALEQQKLSDKEDAETPVRPSAASPASLGSPAPASDRAQTESARAVPGNPVLQQAQFPPPEMPRGSPSPFLSNSRSQTPAAATLPVHSPKEAPSGSTAENKTLATSLGSGATAITVMADPTPERWRAVRSASNDTPAKVQAVEARPASAGSLRGVRPAFSQSPAGSPAPAADTGRATSLQPNTNTVEVFDVGRFEDDRLAEGLAGPLTLVLNKESKTLNGTLENAMPVVIDFNKIKSIDRTLNDPENDPRGSTSVATIHYLIDDQGAHKQVLIFTPRDSMGKGKEIGSIHARRLVRLAATLNPDIECTNESRG